MFPQKTVFHYYNRKMRKSLQETVTSPEMGSEIADLLEHVTMT